LDVVIDLHSHILPGIDDGVATLDEARSLARAAVSEGVTAIAATPHVRADYPTRVEQMEAGVAALNADFAEQGIELEVLHGGELDLEFLAGLSDDELRRFSLGQTGRYLLVEFPYVGWPLALETTLFDLRIRGFEAVLAHPERNAEVQGRPTRLQALVDAGAVVQVTAASLDGRFGRSARGTALALVESGLAHLVASDAHSPNLRAFSLRGSREAIRDEELETYLFRAVPATIAAGQPLPTRPLVRKRRRGVHLR
jgi:protein-tyrosine phosphatase